MSRLNKIENNLVSLEMATAVNIDQYLWQTTLTNVKPRTSQQRIEMNCHKVEDLNDLQNVSCFARYTISFSSMIESSTLNSMPVFLFLSVSIYFMYIFRLAVLSEKNVAGAFSFMSLTQAVNLNPFHYYCFKNFFLLQLCETMKWMWRRGDRLTKETLKSFYLKRKKSLISLSIRI